MASNSSFKCQPPVKSTSNGAFQGEDPLDYALPLAICQICLVVFLTRGIAYILKPLRQPRVVAEIIGGILLGPSALGRNKDYLNAIFPPKSLTVLETLANLGLLLYMFVVGLELDLRAIRGTGTKVLSIAIAGIGLPFVLGIGISFLLKGSTAKGVSQGPFTLFVGVALSITAFPVLARILAELKLLTTEVGQMAMSAAAVNDVAAWILLALAVALSGTGTSPLVAVWVLLCAFGFVLCCVFIVPFVFRKMGKNCSEGEPVNEMFVCATLATVLAAGFITDAIGIHGIFGAFVVGVLIPKEGNFVSSLAEKVEDLVTGLLLPLYFVSSGLKTNVAEISGARSWGLLLLVILAACFGKVVGTVFASLTTKVPLKEAIALGILMNTKGLVELIVLNIGRERGVLNAQLFAIMVLMALFTTVITTPLVIAVYKPARRAVAQYKHRTIQMEGTNSELRILACFGSTRDVPMLVNLLEASRGTVKSEGLCVYALHLMELSERSSAILMVHKATKDGLPFCNKGNDSSNDRVVVEFEAFKQLNKVRIRPMTSISSWSTMHEDICNTADAKGTAMIILQFHKQRKPDGQLKITQPNLRQVNLRVLEGAPCSVAILVDRGLGGSIHASSSTVKYTATVLFFGGHDDCEALAYGSRMAKHPGIVLFVVRFVADGMFVSETTSTRSNQSTGEDSNDEEVISQLKKRASQDSSIIYQEITVGRTAQVIEAIHEHRNCNMFLVGRIPAGNLAASLSKKSDCPELGPVGSLLASANFSTTASVLLVQKYRRTLPPYSLATLKEGDVAGGDC